MIVVYKCLQSLVLHGSQDSSFSSRRKPAALISNRYVTTHHLEYWAFLTVAEWSTT